MWILCILAIVLLIFAVKLAPKTANLEPVAADEQHAPKKFLYRYSIAGINKHSCKKKHEGAFMGAIVPEPDNEFDPNAIKVMHSDGSHLGYIPAKETASIRAVLGDKFKKYPCVGQIKFVKDEDFEPIDEDDQPDEFFVGCIYLDSDFLD